MFKNQDNFEKFVNRKKSKKGFKKVFKKLGNKLKKSGKSRFQKPMMGNKQFSFKGQMY